MASGRANITMSNYDAAASKAGVQTSNSDVAAAIKNGNIALTDGKVVTGSSTKSSVTTNSNEGATSSVVNIYNNAGKMTKVGYTHSSGGAVDLSSQKAAVVLQGNNTGAKSGESTLLGGSGNDTVLAGAGDAVDAGAGSNTIILADASVRSADATTGARIAMTSENGRNNVSGFKSGFSEGSDAIALNIASASVSIDASGNVVVGSGRARTTLAGTGSSSDISANTTAQEPVELLIVDSGTNATTKTAVAGEGSTVAVSGDADALADAYLGNNSGLDFSNFDNSVSMSLQGSSISSASFGDSTVYVSGINAVQLGEGESTVFGSAERETLAAGGGSATIWGSAGKDSMVGFTGNADDKNGSTTFGFIAGDGKDTISNFFFLTADNSLTADKILTTGDFTDIRLNGNDVMLRFAGNTSDMLTVTNAAGKNIQLVENSNLSNDNVTSVLQVAENSLTYDGVATDYIATGSSASLIASYRIF